MEILLIIRFCCNCTYGNPGPLSREVGVSSHPWGPAGGGGGWRGRNRGRQGLEQGEGQQGRDGEQVAVLTPHPPPSPRRPGQLPAWS